MATPTRFDPNDRVAIARKLATMVHMDRGQRYDDAPYSVHLTDVFDVLLEFDYIEKDLLAAAWLHDAVEDPNQQTKKFVAPDEVRHNFGVDVERKVLLLSKEILGQKNPDYNLSVIFADQDTSVAKLGDRENNISTMVGPFKRARLIRYVTETRNEFIPGAQRARRLFPFQIGVYNNLQFSIENQLRLVDKILEGYVPHE